MTRRTRTRAHTREKVINMKFKPQSIHINGHKATKKLHLQENDYYYFY